MSAFSQYRNGVAHESTPVSLTTSFAWRNPAGQDVDQISVECLAVILPVRAQWNLILGLCTVSCLYL